MEKKYNEFLQQLNWRIEGHQNELTRLQQEVEARVKGSAWNMIDSRDIEKINTLIKVIEELNQQKRAFEYIFKAE